MVFFLFSFTIITGAYMTDCIFCKIINGELPSYKIYEDDFCLAFLDIANDIAGHTLVIPKKHYENVMTCDNKTLSRIMETCKKIGTHFVKDCGFDGFNILNACGKAAEQSVFHVHFHILPRKVDDGEKVFPHLSGAKKEPAEICEMLKMTSEEKPVIDDDKAVILYTDGACSGNPGAGGWASILSFKGKEKVLSGGEKETTNNRMELMAVIVGLENVKSGNAVKVFSDSAYVVNAFNQNWIENWERSNWHTKGKSEVQNKDLWQRLLKAMQGLEVEFIKVKGHSDNEKNNRCDALAREEILKMS